MASLGKGSHLEADVECRMPGIANMQKHGVDRRQQKLTKELHLLVKALASANAVLPADGAVARILIQASAKCLRLSLAE